MLFFSCTSHSWGQTDSTYRSPVKDRYGDPISNPESRSPIIDINPSNIKTDYELDSNMRTVTVKEKIGDTDIDYRPPTTLTFEEFAEYQGDKMKEDQWKESVQEKDEKAPEEEGLFGGPIIVGKNGEPIVEIIPSGNVTLEFGGRWQKVDNPAIPVRQQRTGGFEFDQQIRLNVQGNIGDRLKITANWDTKATFDFDNTIKIQFAGKEEDIIKTIEAGNVSFPLKNSLIRGAQNLFGVKTELQFGKLWVTALFSNQRGKTETLVIKGGAQSKDFDIQASDYDYYRHYFVDHYFRENFEGAFKNNPTFPNFGARISRVEVYVTNSSTNTEGLRNIVGVTDLGVTKEAYLTNDDVNIIDGRPNPPTYNRVNDLYDEIRSYPQFRSIDSTEIVFNEILGLEPGTDYEVIKSARQLEEGIDFTFHPELGYISLNSRIDEEEGLAIAFEYTLNGETYKVGELKEDYQTQTEDKVVLLKLIKPQSIRTSLPGWDLLMKNVYSLNTTGVKRENFQLRVIYHDDITNVDNPFLQEGQNMQNVPLLEVMRLDKLNRNGDFTQDRNFDYIEGATINSDKGLIVFPVLEPFGSHLINQSEGYGFDPVEESNLVQKYVFNTLYESTYNDAERQAEKDKFYLKGRYESVSSQNIMLPGINILPGSVTITSGSMTLREGSDYTVDYNIGRVVIQNEGVLASGKEIVIKYEKSDLFNFRTKSLFGTRLEYRFNEDVQLGATWLYMNERPLLTRVNLGDEPIKNHQFGVDLRFHDESRVITKMVDALPVIQTKAESTVDLNLEVAALAPAKSKITNGEAYLEDFEGAETPYDLSRTPYRWNISSTPRILGEANDEYFDWQQSDLQYGYHRAKLSWYNIDNTVYTSNNALSIQSDEFNNYEYTKRIIPQEIFPNQDVGNTINLNLTPLDLLYIPNKRGPYNYNDVDVSGDDEFNNPEENWAGIQRAVTFDTDFDKSNISFIEFWLLNPFEYDYPEEVNNGNTNATGGDMYFHLGNISEDVLKDNRHAFENGLPENVVETDWGRVTTEQFIVNAFNNETSIRAQQDVGLDGLNNAAENEKFGAIIDGMPITPAAKNRLKSDPSSDDFEHYGGNDGRTGIERYFNYAGLENNSPINDGSSFPKASSNYPNNEDLNGDNTLNKEDSYYEYHVDLSPDKMRASTNPYIVSERIVDGRAKWLQFRIPVKDPTQYRKVGNIDGFKTIKFIRTYLTGWDEPVILRMAQFQLVGAQWINFEHLEDVSESVEGSVTEPCAESFTFSTVNIEENGQGSDENSPYVVPPGVIRDIDNTSNVRRQLNEQSLKLQAVDLCPGLGRAVFKNMGHDLLNYKRIKMFIHAEEADHLSRTVTNTQDYEVVAFLRLGTDNRDNYYQIDVPLKLSNTGSDDPFEVWRSENEIDVLLKDLIDTKVERDINGGKFTEEYARTVNGRRVIVKGNPDISSVQTYMIGVRNPTSTANGQPKSIIIWTDELRVGDFNDDIQKFGTAARAAVDMQLADFATVQASGSYTSVGYGDIEQKVSQRSREETVEYGVATNMSLDKLVPGNGIKLPLYASYDKKTVTPQYSPQNKDVLLEDDPKNANDPDFKDKVIAKTEVKSINLTNVRVTTVKNGNKPKIYSPDNITVSAGYTETKASGVGNDIGRGESIESHIEQVYRGSVGYQYTTSVKPIEPFKKVKFLNAKYLKLIKDFNVNPLPNSFGIRADLNRTYIRTQNYVGAEKFTTEGVEPTYEKSYFFDRSHNLRWDFTKSISTSFNSTANSIIDEPDGNKNGDDLITRREYRDSVWTNLQQFGRIKNYAHQINASYSLPLSKIPLIDWIDADIGYKADYRWTASALGLADTNGIDLGNIIGNQQDMTANGKINLTKLYNKSKFLREINSPPRRRPKRKTPTKKDGEGDEEEEEKKTRDNKVLKSTLRVLMMVQNVNLKYTDSRATTMAGFLPSPDFIGLDGGSNAPGYAFIAGSQDPNIRNVAARNGWLSQSPSQNNPFIQDRQQNFTLSSNVEPAKDVRIRIDMKKSTTTGYSEIWRVDSIGGDYTTYNPVVFGNSSMSYMMIGSADLFSYGGDKTFEEFENNRGIVQGRLEAENTGSGRYGLNSQNVLIPAFLSAYSGKDASSTNLNYSPKIPLPNWRVDYNGLAKVGWFKKHFSSISLSHSYSSTYGVTSFKSSLEYGEDVVNPDTKLNTSFEQGTQPTAVNENGEYIPVVVINEVTLIERFSPLLGIRVRTKGRMDFRAEYKTERMFNLDLGNTQVTEVYSKDFVFGFGYTAQGLLIKTKRKDIINIPKTKDIVFKLDFALRDTKTVQRTLDGTDVVTAGNLSIRLYPNITYAISQKLNMQLFFERTINEPRVSSSFRRTSTAFGIKLQFDLS